MILLDQHTALLSLAFPTYDFTTVCSYGHLSLMTAICSSTAQTMLMFKQTDVDV